MTLIALSLAYTKMVTLRPGWSDVCAYISTWFNPAFLEQSKYKVRDVILSFLPLRDMMWESKSRSRREDFKSW